MGAFVYFYSDTSRDKLMGVLVTKNPADFRRRG